MVTPNEALSTIEGIFDKIRVRQSSTDGRRTLVVLVSRRLACLYLMMVRTGSIEALDPDSFEVVTDRVLDATTGVDDWKGRSVVIVDDLLNVGTTLTDRYDDVRALVGSAGSVEPQVAFVNEDRANTSLLKHLHVEPSNFRWVRESNAQKLAVGFAGQLLNSGTPYFTDFPVSRSFRISEDALERLLSNDDWYVADVTASMIADPGVRSLALIPTPSRRFRALSRAVPGVAALADLAKIRLFTRQLPNGVEVCVVPIVIPSPMDERQIDRTFESLAIAVREHFGDDNLLRQWMNWTDAAKHRSIQMYLSLSLLADYWDDLEDVVGEAFSSTSLDEEAMRLYFGDVHRDSVNKTVQFVVESDRQASGESGLALRHSPAGEIWEHKAFRRSILRLQDFVSGLETFNGNPPPQPEPGEIQLLPWEFQHLVLSVFGAIDRNIERPQTERLRDLSYEQYAKFRDGIASKAAGQDDHTRVLTQGAAADEIQRVLFPRLTRGAWNDALVSLVIDIGNDLGISVPTTRTESQSGLTYRQLRVGEGSFLADSTLYDVFCAGRGLDEFTASFDDAIDTIVRVKNENRAMSVLPAPYNLQSWEGVVVDIDTSQRTVDVEVESLIDDEHGSFVLPLIAFGTQEPAKGDSIRWSVYGSASNEPLGPVIQIVRRRAFV